MRETGITLEELSMIARQAGLRLPDADLERLLPAVNRARGQVDALRELITDSVEPAQVFAPTQQNRA
ncbi:MAG TPA: hypothetical protein VNL14_17590 [Candidatus Acidoferrales bacterium]|nr:hypothetical protein [Candidatus Acidoferrales bacterium]